MSTGRLLSWAVPLAVTILSYGLAAGIWKHAALTVGQFCLLFVAAKTVTNWGAWAAVSRVPIMPLEARRFLRIALIGQLFNGFAWTFYFIALSDGPVSIVQTVTAAYTSVSAVLAMIFLRERVISVQVAGIVFVVVAAMLFGWSTGGGETTSEGRIWFTASVLTVLFWGVAVVVIKHAYNQTGANDFRLFIVNWLGMLLVVGPYGVYASQGDAWTADAVALGVVIVLLYCAGDLGFFAAIQRGPASVVSPLSGLYPIPTIMYAALVLNERITALHAVAMAMVLAGIVLIVPEQDNPVIRLLRKEKPR